MCIAKSPLPTMASSFLASRLLHLAQIDLSWLEFYSAKLTLFWMEDIKYYGKWEFKFTLYLGKCGVREGKLRDVTKQAP